MIILQVIFWISIFLILYSYVLFPALLQILARKKTFEFKPYPGNSLPRISVIISAYNEEGVIEEKFHSIIRGSYPSDQLEILIGSDASTDSTNAILKKLDEQHDCLRIFLFEERTGKPGIVNRLVEQSSGEILVLTDANVLLENETLSALVAPFSDPETGLVDTRMINKPYKKEGISRQEKYYISREVRIKYQESLLWGTMMGPFGGCYAVRKALYKPVPSNFLVDDFYINMWVLQQGARCISNIEARVYEDVSNDQREEFRRKKRISAGNFQNLATFGHMLFSGKPGISLCFFSHKVIRWFVPILVLASFGTSVALGIDLLFYRILAGVHLLVFILPVIDHILRKIRIHNIPLRFISHFVLMNVALLAGLFRYIGGIRSNVWQPTRRNQD